jgi:hypothetical protein
MEKKHTALIALVVVGVVAFLAWPHARWFVYGMRVNEVMLALPRFATAENVLALPDDLKAAAKDYPGLDPKDIKVSLKLEARAQAGVVVFYFLVAEVSSGSFSHTQERRIETGIDHAFLDALYEGGVNITKAESALDEDEDFEQE